MPKNDRPRTIDIRQGSGTRAVYGSGSTVIQPPSACVEALREIVYVLYTDNTGTCYAIEAATGLTAFSGTNHAAVIQSAIEATGYNRAIAFRDGVFTIGTPITPKSRQTWHAQAGAYFRPLGNNSILNINGVDWFSLLGTFTIQDPTFLSTSVPAVIVNDCSLNYFQHLVIEDYYDGMFFSATGGGTNTNTFEDINIFRVRNRGVNLTESCHDNHFVQLWIEGPAPDRWASSAGLRIGTDGTQGGNTFDHIQILHMDWGMDLVGASEDWFGVVIIDNAYSEGIWISGQCERLFFDTVWSSSSGDGVIIEGNPNVLPITYADKIHFGSLYVWLNANHGIRFNGYCRYVEITSLFTQRNNVGIMFNGPENDHILIANWVSLENWIAAIDATAAGTDVQIANAQIHDTPVGISSLERLSGQAIGQGRFKNKGVATIPTGAASVVVYHGLLGVPNWIGLTPYHPEVVGAFIDYRDATSFTIALAAGTVTGERQIAWAAESGAHLS